jgi:phage antirepressor YoqD-like protein
LVLRSRKPEAQRFKRWVTHEVLPSIRKTGGYGQSLDMRDHRQLATAALQLIEINEEYRKQLVEAQPKVEGYQKLIDTDGLRGLQQAGKALGMRPNKFIQLLIAHGYLFRREGALVPYQRHIDSGYLRVRNLVVDKHARLQTFITPKGLDHFWRKFGGNQLKLN